MSNARNLVTCFISTTSQQFPIESRPACGSVFLAAI